MRTSPQGIAALAAHEGLVPGPYLDGVNVWTFGIGHTASAGDPDPVKLKRGMPDDLDKAIADAVELFERDLAKFEARVNQHVRAPMDQHEFDALVSFDFNTGGVYYRNKAGQMVNADLVRKLNNGELAAAAAGFMNWRTPASIVPRRQAEQRLFQLGAYPDNPLTVWQVDERGKVIWQPVKQIKAAELIEMIEVVRPGAPPAEAPPENQEAIAWSEWINSAPPGAVDWLSRVPR